MLLSLARVPPSRTDRGENTAVMCRLLGDRCVTAVFERCRTSLIPAAAVGISGRYKGGCDLAWGALGQVTIMGKPLCAAGAECMSLMLCERAGACGGAVDLGHVDQVYAGLIP